MFDRLRHPFAALVAGEKEDCPDDPVDNRMRDPDTYDSQAEILPENDPKQDPSDPHRDGTDNHRIGRITRAPQKGRCHKSEYP